MFQSKYDGEFLQVENREDKVLGDIQIELSTDRIDDMNLQFIEEKRDERTDRFGDYERHEFIYKDSDRASFSFILHCYEEVIHAYTDVKIFSERLFGQNEVLQPENGVIIKIRNTGNIDGLIAHYRHKDWWTRPYFEKDLSGIPPRTQSLLWHNGEIFYQLLPVCDDIFKAEIRGAEQGFNITISSSDHGRAQCQTLAFVLGRGENPFALSKQLTKNVLMLCGKSRTISEKRYPKKLEHLGWCSWDAFYHNVNESGILRKMEEFIEKGLPVKWVMIDDGWSKTNQERLSAFEPDKEKFPEGFKALTDQLKNIYNVESVGVWHTFAGYWGGIDPTSSLADEMTPYIYKTNSEKQIPYPDKGKGFGFWDAWHSYLKQQGIDFVKVDGQSAITNFMKGQMSVGKAALESHKALEASVGIHFDQCMINCMGMAPENIWNRPISAVSRSSDDFVPDDANGFAEHALQNVYNSFYHGELFWGDWDMFWTRHQDAQRHALLRAISGGPIYTSDPVGQTDPEVVKPLIFKDGRILRCDQSGKPTKDMLMKDPTNENVPLKVWNTRNGVGIVAAFNIHLAGNRVQGNVSVIDIDGLSAEEYFVYDYFKQTIDTMQRTQIKDIELEQEEYGLYFIVPKKHSLTPLGLINKYISPATYKLEYLAGKSMMVRLEEGGEFAFVAESKPREIRVNGKKVAIEYLNEEENIYTVNCFDQKMQVIIEIKL